MKNKLYVNEAGIEVYTEIDGTHNNKCLIHLGIYRGKYSARSL